MGHYQSADGRVHGFIARPASEAVSDYFGNVYNVALAKGLNMLSVPLAPPTPMSAKKLAGLTGATTVITLDSANQRFVGWTPGAPNDGFPIEGGKGYIVNVSESRSFAFVGAPWTDRRRAAASPPAISAEISQEQSVWAFVVSGHLDGKLAFDGYQVIVRNLRTNSTITASVEGDYFAAATADLARRSVVETGDVIELYVVGPDGNVESGTVRFNVTPEHLANAVFCPSGLTVSVSRSRIGCCRTTRIRLTPRRGFRISFRVTARYRYPFMTRLGCWFGPSRSVFNPQAFIIVGDVPLTGMGVMPLGSRLLPGFTSTVCILRIFRRRGRCKF